MLHINRAARQEKEKSSQTPRLGMRSYTIDTIETYASATNDTPAPPDFNVGRAQHGFWLRTFFRSNVPPGKKIICFRASKYQHWNLGVRGRKKFCGKREMKISCELFPPPVGPYICHIMILCNWQENNRCSGNVHVRRISWKYGANACLKYDLLDTRVLACTNTGRCF